MHQGGRVIFLTGLWILTATCERQTMKGSMQRKRNPYVWSFFHRNTNDDDRVFWQASVKACEQMINDIITYANKIETAGDTLLACALGQGAWRAAQWA